MAWVWILAAVTLISFPIQFLLSNREQKLYGLVFPAVCSLAASVFIALNLLHAFPEMESFGSFLSVHGNAGFFAVILKVGFLFMPAAVHITIFCAGRYRYKKAHYPASYNKEYKRMLADDL